jgi:hypothetical protein
MRRVLIISPHFPPINAADHQRVRMSLPYFAEFGWEATVLAVQPECIEGGVADPLLEQTIPPEIRVIRVGALPVNLTRRLELGSLALRALSYLWRAGNRLLNVEAGVSPARDPDSAADTAAATSKAARDPDPAAGTAAATGPTQFDLVFLSTTQFPVMILGPIWKRRFGIPYVVDFQDPWLDDYYQRTGIAPPGGKLRYRLSRVLARQLEPRVMRKVSQVISVSPAYVHTLRSRYPHLRPDQFHVIPFGAPERDFALLPAFTVKQRLFDPRDGLSHWVYIGRGGDDMAPALRLLFNGLRELRTTNHEIWRKVRLHFAGTSYAPGGTGRQTIQPIAHECGVADAVTEQTDRLPYFETLKTLTEADALLVVGSESPSYTGSKLYPYILARKPMLSILREDSPPVTTLRRCRAGEVVTFDPADLRASEDQIKASLKKLKEQVERGTPPPTDWAEFEQNTAREMTRTVCTVFDRAVVNSSPSAI